jgi:Leucine-rich repeat (LRR) protein
MNVFNFFKFLEDKEEKQIPIKAKLIYAPESITPEDLTVDGHLDLSDTEITSLPKGLKVDGILNIDNTPMTSLPEGLEVEMLNLRNTLITSLPKRLKVGVLVLTEVPITSLPEGLEVSFFINLKQTPISEKYTKKEIKEMCPGITGDIFL